MRAVLPFVLAFARGAGRYPAAYSAHVCPSALPARVPARGRAVCSAVAVPTNATAPEPLEETAFMLLMTAAFRVAMGSMAGWQSPRPFFGAESGESYRGLVDVSKRLFSETTEETSELVMGVLRQFPVQPQLLQNNRVSCELLGALTPVLFPFLVGRCTTEAWEHSSGRMWKSRVVIEKCRFLETAECKGMCVGLCKHPTERFFTEELGLPLSMVPNFENGSCVMTWGESPRADDMDEQDMSCLDECSMPRAVRGRGGRGGACGIAERANVAAYAVDTATQPGDPPLVGPVSSNPAPGGIL